MWYTTTCTFASRVGRSEVRSLHYPHLTYLSGPHEIIPFATLAWCYLVRYMYGPSDHMSMFLIISAASSHPWCIAAQPVTQPLPCSTDPQPSSRRRVPQVVIAAEVLRPSSPPSFVLWPRRPAPKLLPHPRQLSSCLLNSNLSSSLKQANNSLHSTSLPRWGSSVAACRR